MNESESCQREMTCAYVQEYSLICARVLTHMCNMTSSYVTELFLMSEGDYLRICARVLTHMCKSTHSYGQHTLCLTPICNMTSSYATELVLMSMTLLTHLRKIADSYVQHALWGSYDWYHVINDESHENPSTPGTELKVLKIISRCCATLSAIGCMIASHHLRMWIGDNVYYRVLCGGYD